MAGLDVEGQPLTVMMSDGHTENEHTLKFTVAELVDPAVKRGHMMEASVGLAVGTIWGVGWKVGCVGASVGRGVGWF
jgi:hypothetical protein